MHRSGVRKIAIRIQLQEEHRIFRCNDFKICKLCMAINNEALSCDSDDLFYGMYSGLMCELLLVGYARVSN